MIKIAVIVLALGFPTLSPGWAKAEPLKFNTPATCTTEGGAVVTLPPGVFLSDKLWKRLDAEARRLQDLETRLTVENKSLKKSLGDAPSGVGWVIGTAAGIALGLMVF